MRFDSGFGMFGFVNALFPIIFALVIGVFIFTIVRGISIWSKNNNSPRLIVGALVSSKRTDVSHSHHANAGDATGAHGYYTSSSTRYYVTFEVESGDRMELSVSVAEYGMLAEGDRGMLSFQGTRYLGFERV